MNNPFGLIQALMNPQEFMQNVMANSQVMQNPMVKNTVDMFQRGDTAGLKQMAENLCKEKGTTPQAIQNMIMNQLGMRQ